MTFLIKKSDLIQETTKEYTHKGTGITLKIRSANNPQFQRAFQLIHNKQQEMELKQKQEQENQVQVMEAVSLTAENIMNIDVSELTIDEALVYAMGEHLISDWNVMMEDGGEPEKLAVNGENFIGVFRNIGSPDEFLKWCLDSANEATNSIKEQVRVTAKKPLNVGSGSKPTKG